MAALAWSGAAGRAQKYRDVSVPAEERVRDLVGQMTLDEKAQQLVDTAPSIPRLGIPAYDYWNEGLHGVARSGYATLFPQAIGMAATFDEPLMHEVGKVIGTEARAKYNDAIAHSNHSIYYGLTIWSPNINIFRDPRWGRGQESYGEDPFLTATLGTAFVKGIQGDDPKYYLAISTPKHFAVHSGPESSRHKFDVEPSPHDLWDTYLPAFRATIVDGKAGSIMCAYNRIDGQPACASDLLLKQVLRGDWKFQGFVTSDCGAIDDFFMKNGHGFSPDAEHASAAGIRAGTDTACGKTFHALADAVRAGLIKESELDAALERLFLARFKLGLFDPPAQVKYASIPFSEVQSPEHTATALRVARESMVLLKNNSVLPLKGKKTIAVIGPNADELLALEGNYNAIAKNPVKPVDAIAKEFVNAKVVYAQGAPYAEGVAVVIPRTQLRAADGHEGLKAEFFDNDTMQGTRAVTRVDKEIDFDWNGAAPVDGVNAKSFSARWTGTIQVPEAGDYEITGEFAHCYPCNSAEKYTMLLDGKPVATAETLEAKEIHGSGTKNHTVHFADTAPHALTVTYSHHAQLFGAGLTLRWVPKPAIEREAAVKAASQADAVIAFVGLSPDLEGEELQIQIPGFSGGDRTSLDLPAAQEELLEALKATGKPLVVVLMNGSAVAVNWAKEHADAIVEAWYPGQTGAQAIAEILSGRNNPSGRLPVTFYRSANDLPAFDDYAMANRTYRYFRGDALYGFGYGLSYTSFQYSNVTLSAKDVHAGETLHVQATVSNTGKLAGDAVAELYLTPPQSEVAPRYALGGVQRIHLKAGEQRRVSFDLSPRQQSQVDAKGVRAVRAGSYTVSVGGAQPSQPGAASAAFSITGMQEIPR